MFRVHVGWVCVCAQNDKAKKPIHSFRVVFRSVLYIFFIIAYNVVDTCNLVPMRYVPRTMSIYYDYTNIRIFTLHSDTKYPRARHHGVCEATRSSLWFIWIAFSNWRRRRAKIVIKLRTWGRRWMNNGTKRRRRKIRVMGKIRLCHNTGERRERRERTMRENEFWVDSECEARGNRQQLPRRRRHSFAVDGIFHLSHFY